MPEWLAFLVTLCAGAAAVFGFLVLQRLSAKDVGHDTGRAEAATAIRDEAERTRRAIEDQSRGLRQEIGEGQRGAQESLLAAFRDLSRTLGEQQTNANNRQMAELAAVRQELDNAGRRINEALTKGLVELRAAGAVEAEGLARRLGDTKTQIENDIAGLKEIVRERAAELDGANDRRQRALAEAIGAKFGHFGETGTGMAGLRDELANRLNALDTRLTQALSHLGMQQVGRLDQVSQSLHALEAAEASAAQSLRQALDSALLSMRQEAASKLEDVKRLKELETENTRLRRAIADLTLEKITRDETLKNND